MKKQPLQIFVIVPKNRMPFCRYGSRILVAPGMSNIHTQMAWYRGKDDKWFTRYYCRFVISIRALDSAAGLFRIEGVDYFSRSEILRFGHGRLKEVILDIAPDFCWCTSRDIYLMIEQEYEDIDWFSFRTCFGKLSRSGTFIKKDNPYESWDVGLAPPLYLRVRGYWWMIWLNSALFL